MGVSLLGGAVGAAPGHVWGCVQGVLLQASGCGYGMEAGSCDRAQAGAGGARGESPA